MRALKRIWNTERWLSSLLVILVLTVFVLPPLVPGGALARRLFDAFLCAVLVTGAFALSGDRVKRIAMTAIAIAAVLVRLWDAVAPSTSLELWVAASWVASVGMLSLMVLAQVMASGPVTRYRIEGAIAVYLLLGLAWAGAFHFVTLLQPGAFAGVSGEREVLRDLLYYSYVTLTTVGYGDITPVAPAARSLAILEALTGQLYPAILLARLVSLYSQPGDGGDSAGSGGSAVN